MTIEPAAVLEGWPADRPVAALVSGTTQPWTPWSRWTILAQPESALVSSGPGAARPPANPEPGRTVVADRHEDQPPFRAGWIGCLTYELGHELEPAARHARGRADERRWPGALWLRCPAVLAFDHHRGRWWSAGDRAAAARLEQTLASTACRAARPWRLGTLQSQWGRDGFTEAVRRAIEYVHAGDVFQVNLAHRMSGAFAGSARGLMAALWRRAQPWMGAYVEWPDDAAAGSAVRRIVASISPELLVCADAASRRVVTRPMKGTRRGPGGAASLEVSTKDAAELNMIIDLMRNDIGRVCELGSVRVDEARAIERHAGTSGPLVVHQGVATVSGRLRAGANAADLLAAVFPGGSVTGAPKIRAMQIIEELEPLPRGPYCGSIGYADDDGSSAWSVAIRTAAITGPPAADALDTLAPGATLDFPVGAGIVAASDPEAEWLETLDKAALIASMAGDESRHA